jgi:hypothetical protein
MQSRLSRILTGLGLLFLGAGVAWAARPSRTPDSAQTTSPAPDAKVAQADVSRAVNPPVTEHVRAPLVVSFEEPRALPSGEIELPVVIEVRDSIAFPLAFRATLPRDATLVDGSLDAPVDGSQPGRQTRVFRFRHSGPLAADNPFRVAVHGEAADKSMGISADRVYPAVVPVVRPPSAGPRPPNGRPPVAISAPKAP